MGRVKLELKRIEKNTNRQITFSKRKKGLIKKAYELSTLCDIDLALLMFSPSDRLCLFSGQTSIEDVFARYINLPDQERENAIVFPNQTRRQAIQNKECLLRILEQLKTENDMAMHNNESRPVNSNVEELEQEVCSLQQQLQMSEEELRKFEPDPVKFTSMEDIEECEAHLINTLTRVVQRREHLLNKSCEAPSTQKSRGRVLVNNVVQGWGFETEPKQAHVIPKSAHHSNQPSYDLLLRESNSSSNQNPK